MCNLLDFDPDCSGSDAHEECEHPEFLAWLEENNL